MQGELPIAVQNQSDSVGWSILFHKSVEVCRTRST